MGNLIVPLNKPTLWPCIENHMNHQKGYLQNWCLEQAMGIWKIF